MDVNQQNPLYYVGDTRVCSHLIHNFMDKMMNQKNVTKTAFMPVMAALSLLLMSGSAMAHEGHDHAANESMLIHVLFYGAIGAVVALAVFFAYRQLSKKNQK